MFDLSKFLRGAFTSMSLEDQNYIKHLVSKAKSGTITKSEMSFLQKLSDENGQLDVPGSSGGGTTYKPDYDSDFHS